MFQFGPPAFNSHHLLLAWINILQKIRSFMLLEHKEPSKLSATDYFWLHDSTPHSHNTFWNLPRRQHWSHQHIWKSVSQVYNWVVSIHPLFPMIETGSVLTSSHNSACRCWELLFFILIKTIIKSSSWPFDLKLLEQSNNDIMIDRVSCSQLIIIKETFEWNVFVKAICWIFIFATDQLSTLLLAG